MGTPKVRTLHLFYWQCYPFYYTEECLRTSKKVHETSYVIMIKQPIKTVKNKLKIPAFNSFTPMPDSQFLQFWHREGPCECDGPS